jgi:carboxyl-terminal processing protease
MLSIKPIGILSFSLVVSLNIYPQTFPHFQQQAILLKRVIELNHYSPRPVDDLFSAQVFDRMIERLDDDQLYFTKNDIRQLSVYREQIDDELQGRGWHFLDTLTSIYRKKLLIADSTIIGILQKPFDYSIKENISFLADSLHFALSEIEYQYKWYQWLKYETLVKTYDLLTLNQNNQNLLDKKLFANAEADARKKIKSTELRKIHRVLESPGGFDNYLATLFCEIISSNFDPHTEFFSPSEKDQFLTDLNSDGLYYGFSISEDDKGDLEIANLMPGGPAWKTGELNKGDEILQLAFDNNPPVDLAGASSEEALAMLDKAGNVPLQLTVRKTSGLVKTVSLIKERVRNDDNVVKSFILKADKKIGYISLPGFYTDAEGESTASCANDVAKAIVNLKKENIDGLMLDLRNNGGGSLREALDMAGIFIDVGPLSMYKERAGKLVTLKDLNQGTIYDGPLLLLVNGQSASASELLAAVLQDYHRAIIAGSLTYGKGTAQSILALDTSVQESAKAARPDQKSGFGYVKVTIGKFYRISGKTTQQVGVISDVHLPDILDDLKFRELTEPFSLLPDTVKKNAYYKPLPPLPSSTLAERSEERLRNNKSFDAIRAFSKRLGNKDQRPVFIPLEWDAFRNWSTSYQRISAEALENEIRLVHPEFTVDNNPADKEFINADDYAREINKNWLKRLQQDIYIGESMHIMSDYISLTVHQ